MVKKKQIKIAVIDSAINDDLLGNMEISTDEDDLIEEQNDISVYSLHGASCVSIIDRYNKNAIIYSISILNSSGKGIISDLEPALENCYMSHIRLVNLSFGTIHFQDKSTVRKIINHYANRGMIIVAATANNGYTAYPASFSNVIGVASGNGFCVVLESQRQKGIDFFAPSNHVISINEDVIRLQESNSYSAPYVTAMISRMMESTSLKNICAVRKKLLSRFPQIKNYIYYPDWIENAWVSEKCKKSEAQYYFSTVEDLFSRETQIDTLVVKDVREYKKYAETGKHIVYLGNTSVSRPKHNIHFWSPELRIEQIMKSYKRLSEIDIPIIICRFDEWQDEILWLCELKSCFSEDGHNIYAVSLIIECVLYDLEYIPAKLCNRKHKDKICDFLYWQTYYNQSDAILLSEQGQQDSYILPEHADLTLEVTGNEEKHIKIYCEDQELPEETLSMSAKDATQYVYKKIYKLLTEDMDEQ